MDKLRWGLLSTARINRAVIPPIRSSKRSDLVAVASRSQASADAYAKEWDIPRAFGSYEALLADPDINAIYITCTRSGRSSAQPPASTCCARSRWRCRRLKSIE